MTGNYEVAFKEALNRTNALGLSVPQVQFSSDQYISETAMDNMGHKVSQWFPNLRAEDLVGQCTTVHANFRGKVEELLGVPTYLTIGDISFSGEKVFNVDDAYINHLWNNTITIGDVVKLHAWLTLPSMEIIDVTLAATYLALDGQPFERHGDFIAAGAIANHADEMKAGLIYHPYIIGQDYLQKVGAMAYVNPQQDILRLFQQILLQ